MPQRPEVDDASEDALLQEAEVAKLDTNLSFSKVNYGQMAPHVNLDPRQGLEDAPSFDLYRSRIPMTLFRDIIAGIDKTFLRYGPMTAHQNEETRSQFLSPIFDCLVPLFGSHIRATPEARRWTTKGRVEYQFIILGTITVLFVEYMKVVGGATEHLNAVAQLIAECDAGDFANQRTNLHVPVYGILYDGNAFEFFLFSRNTKSPSQPSFFCGLLEDPTGSEIRMPLALLTGKSSALGFMRDLRLICEIIFDLLLKSYIECLTQYSNVSQKGSKSGSKWPSLDGWDAAIKSAKETLDICRQADQHRAAGEWEASNAKAECGMQMLGGSVIAVPRVRLRSVLDDFTECAAMVNRF
ncbi:uncharacterized protein EI90DRAFT_3062859 [Cantharellus anzutake]|uniref:uncharacterized protein n=1 Tax=Cantharellus anzutake TaxID=1750568 RepID=UPI001905CAD5|nr:uncharacterized protein EI90DRAFT_3062859 [Cantharellus anzutake]KAF8329513.1 hypothetical protein EI90DRAFT_3062859 [Cantharellus anzutake]